MTTRIVTGTILKPDGTVYTAAAIIIKLKDDIVSSGVVVPKYDVFITTSATGTFSVALYVPDSGTCTYELILATGYSYEFELGSGSSIGLSEIVSIPTVSEDPNYITELTSLSITTITDAATLSTLYDYWRCNGTFTVTLPAATGSGDAYIVANVGTGTITVATTGGDTISGTTPLTIPTMTIAYYIDGIADNWDSNW